MASRAKAASTAPTAAETNADSTDGTAPSTVDAPAGDTDSGTMDQTSAPQVAATTDTPAEAPVSEPAAVPPEEEPEPEQPEQPSLADRLAVLGLDLGGDDMVGLTMLISMEGPTVSLSRMDPHRCDPEEAIRLVQARFAKPA